MPDYIPSRIAEQPAYFTNFSARITAAPTSYDLDIAQATAYADLLANFIDSYTLATNPPTRTKGTIESAKVNRLAIIALTREYARIIQAAPGVTGQMKIDLGLPVHKTEPTPQPIPTEMPKVDIESVNGRLVRVRVHGEALARGKPSQVYAASVWTYVGATASEDVADWKLEGSSTKTIFNIEFPATVPAGATVWITAAWLNRKLEAGPGCPPVSTHLQFGAMAQAA